MHGLLEKQVGAQHDEDRAGEANGRHVSQRNVGQGRVPQQQCGSMHRPAHELPADILRPIRGKPSAQHQRHHHQQAAGVAQKLRLQGVELLRHDALDGVQTHEQQACGTCPQQALNSRIQLPRTRTRSRDASRQLFAHQVIKVAMAAPKPV